MNKIIKSPFSKDVYKKNAMIYKVLANAKRLEILNIIKDKEANVNDLSKTLGTRKSNTSQHLAYLRYLGLVKARRDGKNIYYTVTDSRIVEPDQIFKELRESGKLLKVSNVA
jgi:DNA-binding transcriptional ArsR family regulator